MIGRTFAVAALLALAPSAASQSDWLRVEPEVQSFHLIYQLPAVYPELAKQMRVAGPVRLAVMIGRDGSVEEICLVSGHPLLVKAAMDAVKQWRYRPTYWFGHPMRVATLVTVCFTLNGSPGAPHEPTRV